MHINCLELLAATLAVKAFLKDQRGVSVKLQLDNQTAVAYISNMGGTVSPQLTNLQSPVDVGTIQRHCADRRLYSGVHELCGKRRVQNLEGSNRLEAHPSNTIYDKTFEGKSFCGCAQNTLFTRKLSWCIRPMPICTVHSK